MSFENFDVFLCHNDEDKLAVLSIAARLQQKGIRPWLDRWNLIPGIAWQPDVEKALEGCGSCAVFPGPSGVSPWQDMEMRVALARQARNESSRGFRVIPVLLPGVKESKPIDGLYPFLITLLNRLDWLL